MDDPINDFMEALREARRVSEEKSHVGFLLNYNRGPMAGSYSKAMGDKIDRAYGKRHLELVDEEKDAWVAAARAAMPVIDEVEDLTLRANRQTMRVWGDLLRAQLGDAVPEDKRPWVAVSFSTTKGAAQITRLGDIALSMRTCPSQKGEGFVPTLADSTRTRHVHFMREWVEGIHAELKEFAREHARLREMNEGAERAAARVRKIFSMEW